ncbi:hypothetical protein JTE90_010642 [Oedothorax gibbosus]|uniref:Uncharacterized protein n=1 Tax=Oedothorax gibbosus TaxID=931172 RepID=A0AAV6UAZ3_9ARAC|nr:hypothetical protein JTE90_010642 [Oedothorax gibbosus]
MPFTFRDANGIPIKYTIPPRVIRSSRMKRCPSHAKRKLTHARRWPASNFTTIEREGCRPPVKKKPELADDNHVLPDWKGVELRSHQQLLVGRCSEIAPVKRRNKRDAALEEDPHPETYSLSQKHQRSHEDGDKERGLALFSHAFSAKLGMQHSQLQYQGQRSSPKHERRRKF